MKLVSFFIERPIVAAVLSITLVIAGTMSLFRLPLSEYPAVTPPTVMVQASYPGASPEVLAETVAAPIEQEVNGTDGLLYMSSQSTADGRLSLTLTFEHGIDPDIAQIQVQNRVSRAVPRLPQTVQRIGVTTQKTSPDMLMVVHLVSPDASRDTLFLSNFAIANVRDELRRLAGVGDVVVWGSGEYSMRIWLDPEKVAARELTASDVVRAIREQNVEVAAGAIGAPPSSDIPVQATVSAKGRLLTEAEFGDLVVRTGADGQITRLRDVARVELGADAYALRSLLDGKPAVGIQIVQRPGANALDTAARVRSRMTELASTFPAGVQHRIAYDPTIFVRASIDAVLETLLEAIVLVVIVVVVFLQSWRAAVIPLIAVPVSLVGTLAIMQLIGASLNTLSLFGLVLSIGIVVDDAIVLVENVERHLRLGASPREAAHKAMAEVTGPIIAITSVLVAVFVPTAFLSGLTGQFYSQFALTIAVSTVLSAVNSLTLSPALAAVLLRPHGADPDRLTRILDAVMGWFFRLFNRGFDAGSRAYAGLARRAIRLGGLVIVLYGALVGATWVGFTSVPTGFVPAQDKYYLVGIVQLPAGASLDRTDEVTRRVSEIALAEDGVESVVAFPGLSINGFVTLPNAAVFFTTLDPFESRQTPELSAAAIAKRLQGKLFGIRDGFVGVFPPPPVPGLGPTGGFKMLVEDRSGQGPEALYQATQALIAKAGQTPGLMGLLTSFDINAPQVALDVDREKAKSHGVAIDGAFEALQIYLGSLYANDFNLAGRTYRVILQADQEFRGDAAAIRRIHVRNAAGALVPLSAFVSAKDAAGPDRVIRYNSYPAADVSGMAAPGVSSGEAVARMETLARETLPSGMTFEWTDLTFQEKLAGNAGLWVFPLAVLLAYLILAVQYNSLVMPLVVLLIAPMALLSAIAGVWWTNGDNNVFTQIGFLVLVGLAAKNAILIVEFARERESEGMPAGRAAVEAARLRLRPVLMTSIAFVMGVIPLVAATGAGAEMRHAMGIAVFFGMIGVTLFGLVLTPVFYVSLGHAKSARARPAEREVSAAERTAAEHKAPLPAPDARRVLRRCA
ncbi:MAG TPA: multidrug efflux RND transporter permease subunit [Microvirga sp.]|nr:multidrug efflux RND transporter permease subunit [Microvirga sp.]